MKIICENCGAELTVREGESYAKCAACGYISQIGIPEAGDENRYAKADFYLKEEEFDLAYREYGKILDLNSGDAKAHWGQFLCRYGIEYVKDPATGKKMPTLHRNLPQSVLDCPSYLLALETVEPKMAAYYQREAEAIRKIQLYIEDTAKKIDPFDIFISYKEEDNKTRTEDSYRAQDIYRSLTDMGYHVFYARETLLKKSGEEYEPIIYSALSTAKMMLALGTKKEYFNAVWVRNEWGRFLELKKQDRSRILVPVYRDIEDLPDELSIILESQNIDAPDFQSELLKYVKATVSPSLGRSLASRKESEADKEERRRKTLITDGYYRLEEGNFAEAEKIFKSLTKEKILNYQIALGLLYVGKKVRNQNELIDLTAKENGDLSREKWYQKARELAEGEEQEELENLLREIAKKREQKEQQSQQKRAYQERLKQLTDEITSLIKSGNQAAMSKEAKKLVDTRLALARRKEALLKGENLEKPVWWVLIVNLILMLLPANVILLYFFEVGGKNYNISESFLLLAAGFIIAHGVLMILKKNTGALLVSLIWVILLVYTIKSPGNALMLYVLEAVAVLTVLVTLIRNLKLKSDISRHNREQKQYKKEVEELAKYVRETILPYYKEQMKQLTRLAVEGGIGSEERLENEMALREKLEPLEHQITYELTL